QNLKYFEDSLPKDEFVRVHRSYIVHISKLNTITKKLVSIGNTSIPVSDHYREKLFCLIGT
ncbi:MAG TPA: LytTR family DNA-binding domain-containing protein, partial [Flavisolibacter sp.]|nr:LytTR family DNA-binding domain-containing protein [Flavisolibacter sp.]